MILIGSQALQLHLNLNRPLHDYDFIMDKERYEEWLETYTPYWVKTTNYSHIFDVKGDIVEVRNPKYLDPTDLYLLGRAPYFEMVNTMHGLARLPNLAILRDMTEIAVEVYGEPKHKNDLAAIHNFFPSFNYPPDSDFFLKRREETKNRDKSDKKLKYDFFHKYHIPEYIIHDRLHDMIADLCGINMPTYARLTTGATDIAEELFNKLTHDQKISLMAEEALVLALERWFIPQNVERGINVRLIDKFYNNNEAGPTYRIFKHVNSTGLKGEAAYVTGFARANFFEIEKRWQEYKLKIKAKGGFHTWFFNELFEVREKYKLGEQVATV